ncbi:hypothetical protein MC7420_934 [Coleofasciculus chthonoplastes PCC 7420]|uniref:Uncharacterized protein n=1 Tax=Coleofasciculus chthonoplastes PCC 7420 TaxID=118168 RepID=B4W0F3_9CYAN|nr:hypothetical protein MC7420_934 [Coleofasciculus chthonoplastes PCC 7420]
MTEGFIQGNRVVFFISMASPCSGKMYPCSSNLTRGIAYKKQQPLGIL